MIATSKTRSWFGLSTSLLLVVMVAGLAGCGISSAGQTHPTATPVPATATPLPPTAPVVTSPIDDITMVSATIGWGRVHSGTYDSEIAYTVNGGQTWYDVTPPELIPEAQSTIALYPRSATEAWTWLSGGGSSTTLWQTTDAGSQWTAYTVATSAVLHLDFIDSLHGWLDASPAGSAAGLFPINVWRTTDGGSTWTQVASYYVWAGTTGLSFANATDGTACSGLGTPLPYLVSVTHDAGSTWSKLSLPPPSGYSEGGGLGVEPPVFTSATAGILEVISASGSTSGTSQGLFTVYRTTDAGSSWQLGPSLSGVPISYTNAPMPSLVSSVLSTGEVLAAATVNGQLALYQLPAGATSWTKINTGSSSTALLSGMTQLDFVNQMSGWAVTSAGLIGTTDGGVTWTLLHA